MGKKRNIIMDENQQDDLMFSSKNKYDLPEEFNLIENEGKSLENQSEEEVKKVEKKTKKVKKHRSGKYQSAKKLLDKTKLYKPEETIRLVLTASKEKFDTTLELHAQMKKENLSGKINLPHSTGKQKKVVIFDEKVLSDIEAKKIDFDILLAKPQDMAKLAKHARFLGPKGLMPNPKNGTISADPKQALKNFSGNNISYKTEKKAPLIHLAIGKKSLGEKKLTENLIAILQGINPKQIKKANICTSMSPSIKLEINL